MNKMDIQYINIVKTILEDGYYDNNRTRIKTLKIPHQIMSFDLEKDFPILQTKFVGAKTAIKELLWIYQKQSNKISDLHEQGVHIWDEWTMDDGTIGTSYGWIIKEYNQIDRLINGLKHDPQGRRHIMSLWQIPHLDGGALYPCAFMTMWDVTDGKLNCMLIQRSCDIPLGGPFNTLQYAVLTHLIAQVVGLKVGKFTHVINNAHIYENQIDGMKEQIARYEEICMYELFLKDKKEEDIKCNLRELGITRELSELKVINDNKPYLSINPYITNFYDFTIDDIKIENYNHMGKINMPVSV